MTELDFPLSLGFEDVGLQQNKNICKSRLDVNIKSEVIRGVELEVPLISANMSTVTNPSFANKINKLGGLGILHRACGFTERINDVVLLSKTSKWVASSVGVGLNEYEAAKELIRGGCNIIVIDIAHGYSDEVFAMCKMIKMFSPSTKVVVGNTTSLDCFRHADRAGADGLKVGIANGAGCSTKDTAGANEKQFSSVYKFRELSQQYGLPIISDGGIRRPADFTLSIAAGANSAMAGSIFARCPESAADTVMVGDKYKKVYAGMASAHVQEKWKGGLKEGTCAEGKVLYLDIGEPLENLMERYSGALRSGITYAGGNDIKSFQQNARFVRFR
jgi:IMP dehydrogenase/GMP reductase